MLPWLVVAALASEPEPVWQAPRAYPSARVRDRSVTLACTVEIALGDRGRPRDVVAVGCPPEVAARAVRVARRDRWPRETPAGTVVHEVLVFLPPADTVDLPAPDTWRWREATPCAVHLVVAADGGLELRRGEASCAPDVTVDAPPTPPGLVGGRVPRLCPVTFVGTPDGPRDLQVFRCAPDLWGHARRVVRGLAWPPWATPLPTTILLQLDGD